MEVLNSIGICLCLIKAKFLLLLIRKCIGYYVDLMVFLLFLFIWLYVGYNHGHMIDNSHGYFHFFTCN